MSQRNKLPYNCTFEFLGAKINFRIIGNGPPIILLHGSMVYDPWGGFEEVLAKDNKVYWIDLPGFGGSDVVDGRLHNTDLFAECVGEFIKSQGLLEAPIISLSLGTVVAAKAVASGQSKGKQLMVAAPGKLFGAKARMSYLVPVFIRRLVASTDWGKKTFRIPMIRENVGYEKNDDVRLLRNLQLTDTRSLADTDFLKEIEVDMPTTLDKIKNKEIHFVYGENDNQRGTLKQVKKYYTIAGAGHNPFGSHPKELMEIIREIKF